MIQLIKDKLGADNVLYIEQIEDNYCVFNYKIDDSYEVIQIYFKACWKCSFYCNYLISNKS